MEGAEVKLYGKWSFEDVEVNDMSLEDYVAVKPKYAGLCPTLQDVIRPSGLGRRNAPSWRGVIRRQSVDVSPLRRVNQAIYLLTTGAREAAFRNIKTIAECLADELINAAKGSSNSYAIKKKDEIERVAKANR
eukprot:jgi/Pico_ML_1/50999/g2107.t1